ncbi:DUF805 domain-containing protein [Pseudoalteromonas sp. N1230-9]|uniref:DUF805 domain-containing protein n=1 Tax=unclassified Pseudoalteromonas TaxID=194690 RepID=UPI002B2BFE5C|nr:DUF805 domain-containing protein [Pseudoalteromonas sp. N1230-9]
MSENVYQAPESDVANISTDTTTMSRKDILFSFQGRIPRKTYWLSVLVLMLISVLGMLVLSGIGAMISQNAAIFLPLLIYIPLIWSSLAIQVKRWHDRNKSGWWVLIGLVPVIGGIWVLIENGFLAGDEAENRFGKPTV